MPKIEFEIESADEFLLADDEDIAAFENETEFMNNSDYGTLAPYGWD